MINIFVDLDSWTVYTSYTKMAWDDLRSIDLLVSQRRVGAWVRSGRDTDGDGDGDGDGIGMLRILARTTPLRWIP